MQLFFEVWAVPRVPVSSASVSIRRRLQMLTGRSSPNVQFASRPSPGWQHLSGSDGRRLTLASLWCLCSQDDGTQQPAKLRSKPLATSKRPATGASGGPPSTAPGLPSTAQRLAASLVRLQRRAPAGAREEATARAKGVHEAAARAEGTASGSSDWSALLGQVLNTQGLGALQ